MNENSCEKKLLTFNKLKLNLQIIALLFFIILIYFIPYQLIWCQDISIHNFLEILGETKFLGYDLPRFILVFLISIATIILHELIHGVTFAFFSKKGVKSIKFGVIWNKLTPYCHCKEPLLLKYYIIGGAMPMIILGFIPFVYSLIFGNFILLIFAFFCTVGAIGDLIIIYMLRNEDRNNMVLDHPSEVGCFIYRKKIII